MRKIVASIFLGLGAVAQAGDRGGDRTNQVIAAPQPQDTWIIERTDITCRGGLLPKGPEWSAYSCRRDTVEEKLQRGRDRIVDSRARAGQRKGTGFSQ